MPAPDQSRGQAPAGIQGGEEVAITENLDSRFRGHDGPSLRLKRALSTIEGARDFNHPRYRHHSFSRRAAVPPKTASLIGSLSGSPRIVSI